MNINARRGEAAVHEHGATIRPRRAKYLAIPLPAALSSRGTLLRRPRKWKNTFVAKSRKGNLIIFQKRGKTIIPLFVPSTNLVVAPRVRGFEPNAMDLYFFDEVTVE